VDRSKPYHQAVINKDVVTQDAMKALPDVFSRLGGVSEKVVGDKRKGDEVRLGNMETRNTTKKLKQNVVLAEDRRRQEVLKDMDEFTTRLLNVPKLTAEERAARKAVENQEA
jgi:hypothetical protein